MLRMGDDADLLHDGKRLLSALSFSDAAQHERQLHILNRRILRHQVVALEHEADVLPPKADARTLAHVLNVLVQNDDLTRGRLFQSREHIEHRRFTGAASSGDADELAGADRQAHAVQCVDVRLADHIFLAHVLQPDNRRGFVFRFFHLSSSSQLACGMV